MPDAGILSLDARGHGETVYQRLRPGTLEPIGEKDGSVLDLSLGSLSEDLVTIVRLTQMKMGWTDLPGLVLVGHSLGGAVVVDVAKRGKLGSAVLAYAVLDVVEGISFFSADFIYLIGISTCVNTVAVGLMTDSLQIGSAIDALQSMQTYLSSRPTTFPSISAGIEWQ